MDEEELIPFDSDIVHKQEQYYMREAQRRDAAEALKVIEQLPPEYKGTRWKVRNMSNGRRYFTFQFKNGDTKSFVVDENGHVLR